MSLLFHQIDESRRRRGRLFDLFGMGPIGTPSRVVFSSPIATLLSYGPPRKQAPVMLIVPAPIKGAAIWDLAPGRSVVQQCLDHGFQVYLIRWKAPPAGEAELGLGRFADRSILDCLDTVEAEQSTRRPVFMAGHSLGGTFAAIFSSLHPGRVRGLLILAGPLHFGPDVSHFGPLVALAPPVRHITRLLGNVPGSFLNAVSMLASPASFQTSRWMDRLRSMTDADALLTHLRVERWTLDELPMPRQLFEEVVEWLYRENRFMKGTLLIGGKNASPGSVSAPVLSVVDRRSLVVPPEAVLPFHQALRHVDQRVIPYHGDVGVALQHVGMLVGRKAHLLLWPEIFKWLRAH